MLFYFYLFQHYVTARHSFTPGEAIRFGLVCSLTRSCGLVDNVHIWIKERYNHVVEVLTAEPA